MIKKIVILVTILVILGGVYFFNSKGDDLTILNSEKEGFSETEKQELYTAVFEQAGPRAIKVIGFDQENIDDFHYANIEPKDIEDVITIEAVNDSGTAAKGKFFDQYGWDREGYDKFFWGDWIAWKKDQHIWFVTSKVSIGSSEEKFFCSTLDSIPSQFREFFRDEISSRADEDPCVDYLY